MNEIQWSDFIGVYGLQLEAEHLSSEQIAQARAAMRAAWIFMTGEDVSLDDAVSPAAPSTAYPHAASAALTR